ncbi:MAG: hypothetical protein H6570_09940 [Lewinellaceae bacterium]|nr:hypothetical protein [Lewinellaceae bacterium]
MLQGSPLPGGDLGVGNMYKTGQYPDCLAAIHSVPRSTSPPGVLNLVKDLKAYMHNEFESEDIAGNSLYCGCVHSREKKSKTTYKAGNSCLSILLMNLEASIFVDLLLHNLQEEGFHVITKHDSILVPESQFEVVKAQVSQMLDAELGEERYRLKQS